MAAHRFPSNFNFSQLKNTASKVVTTTWRDYRVHLQVAGFAAPYLIIVQQALILHTYFQENASGGYVLRQTNRFNADQLQFFESEMEDCLGGFGSIAFAPMAAGDGETHLGSTVMRMGRAYVDDSNQALLVALLDPPYT